MSMNSAPSERIVISYMNEEHYHRSDPNDELRPACRPDRIRGVVAIRTQAERRGQTACPRCWPKDA